MTESDDHRQQANVSRDLRMRSPSVERNRGALLDALGSLLPPSARVLEVGSGSGEHAVHLAENLPELVWIPSDQDEQARESIRAWTEARKVPGVLAPLALDIEALPWELDGHLPIDAVVSINVIHITPPSTTTALLAGAAQALGDGGQLILYGPFRRNGRHTAPSNVEFERWLKSRDPLFGVRDLDELGVQAAAHGLQLQQVVEMPANNLTVVFERSVRGLR